MVLWAIAAAGMLLAAVYIPFLQDLVKVTAISTLDWTMILGASFLATAWIEAAKYLKRK